MKIEEKKKNIQKDVLEFLKKNQYGIDAKYEIPGYHYYFNMKVNEKNIPDEYKVENFLNDIFRNMNFVKLYLKDKLKNPDNRLFVKDFLYLYLTNVVNKYDYNHQAVSQIIDIMKPYPSLKDFIEHKNIISHINSYKFIELMKHIKSQDDKNSLLCLFMVKNKNMIKPESILETALDNQKKFWIYLKKEQLFSKNIIKEVFQKFENEKNEDEIILENLRNIKKIYRSILKIDNLEELFQNSSLKKELTFRSFLNKLMEITTFKSSDNVFFIEYNGIKSVTGIDVTIKSNDTKELAICEEMFFQYVENIVMKKTVSFQDLYTSIKNTKEYDDVMKDIKNIEKSHKKTIKV